MPSDSPEVSMKPTLGTIGESPALADRVKSLRLPRQTSRAKGSTAWVAWSVVGLLVAVIVYLVGFRGAGVVVATGSDVATQAAAPPNNGAETSAPAVIPAASPKAPVAATTDGKGPRVVLEAKGYIIPAHQILVTPKVNGMVVSLSIEEGRRVKKGDVLAVLESVDYEADVKSAEAHLASARQRLLELENGARPEEITQAKAELAESESQLVQLKAEYDRNVRLRSNRVLAEKELEVSESAYKVMDRRVARLKAALSLLIEGPRAERIDAAKAEVRQAEADLVKAKWRLSNCTIRAPVSGTILKKNAEEGNIVNPIAFNGSYSLCDMADLADLEVDLSIQERDISKVSKGQRCTVRADAFPERVYQGVVSRLMPIADRAKGAVPVRVKLTVPSDEEGVYLKPEMGAVVAFLAN